MGVEVASLTYADAQKLTASLGYTCQNQSVKAAIERMREAKRKEVAEKMKAGDPDAMSGASILMGKSKREKNPQVRWSCEKADPAKLTDRKRETVPGRLLMVFDTPDIPVRHVSYRRSHPEERTAYIDLLGTMKALEAIFGKPTSTKNIPTPNEAGEVAFGDFKAVRVDWKYADLHVKVHAMKMGKRVSINEAMEVPWPVRVTDKQ